MQTGTVKALLGDKGYGFIKAPSGEDVFFHLSVVEEAQRGNLVRGAEVSFELGVKRGKPHAIKVEVSQSAPVPPQNLQSLAKPVVRVGKPDLTSEEQFEREWGLRRAR